MNLAPSLILMLARKSLPLLALMFVAGAASGFYFDRWLHRPIVVEFQIHEALAPDRVQV